MPLLKASELYASRYEVLIYGEPGVGKTTLCGGAENALFITVDSNGATVLRQLPNAENLNVFYSRSWKEIANYCAAISSQPVLKETDVIIVDTVSELQQLDRARQIGIKSLTEDAWELNQSVYSRGNARVLQVGRQLRATGKSIIWLCHAVEEILGEGKLATRLIRPALSSSLLGAIQANLDGQFYYRKSDGQRILDLSVEGIVQTKNRFSGADKLRNPKWEQLNKLLTSHMKTG